MRDVGYDINKLPLGELAEESIKEGYKYLCEIEKVLKEIKAGN